MRNFQKWNTAEFKVERPFFLEKIEWNSLGLEIVIEEDTEEKNIIKLLFEDIVYSYTNTLESYKPSVWIDKEEDYYPFYYSHCTEDIKNFCKDLEYIEDEIIHFLVIGIDHVLDIFTSDFPSIERL